MVSAGSNIFSLLNVLAQVYLPCWFGNMIREKVRMNLLNLSHVKAFENIIFCQSIGISDKIFNSDFFTFDEYLKKDLILIIQMSQKAKIVRAWKFFILKLPGFTSVCTQMTGNFI